MFYNMYFPKYSTLRKLTLTLGGGGVGRVQQKNFSHLDYTHTKKKNESERKKVHCEDDKRQTSSVFVGINKH